MCVCVHVCVWCVCVCLCVCVRVRVRVRVGGCGIVCARKRELACVLFSKILTGTVVSCLHIEAWRCAPVWGCVSNYVALGLPILW